MRGEGGFSFSSLVIAGDCWGLFLGQVVLWKGGLEQLLFWTLVFPSFRPLDPRSALVGSSVVF